MIIKVSLYNSLIPFAHANLVPMEILVNDIRIDNFSEYTCTHSKLLTEFIKINE